jgi:Motility quorum-sensing regulator, toxin of MqsA
MPRWLPKVLKRVRQLAAAGELRLTYKAVREAAALSLSPDDVREVVAGLGAKDSASRLASEATGEWMYVFTPEVGRQIVYVKLVLRDNCVVVSFHENEGGGHEEDE